MGDYAASGGYLVAVGADAIVAEPSTLTGSIGVFALKPDLSGLLGKLGVAAVDARSAAARRSPEPRPALDREERALVERQIERPSTDLFVGRVAEGRTPVPRGGGARWRRDRSGRGQALERGLVDRLGSFEDAHRARRGASRPLRPATSRDRRRRAGPRVPPGLAGRPRLAGGEAAHSSAAARLPELRALAALLELGPVVALPPGWVRRA